MPRRSEASDSGEPVALEGAPGGTLSALWLRPATARACLVVAHGAGAGMRHAGMAALAEGLASRGVASLRFHFPYMERGAPRPDPPAVAQAAVRLAVAEAARRAGTLPLFAGGRSFGGRMTSQAQAAEPLPRVLGLVFFAFPLHPAGRPSDARATHLDAVSVPMLFIQGSRDALADPARLAPVLDRLGPRATLLRVEAADHAFHVPAATGRRDPEVLAGLLDGAAAWMAERAASARPSRADA